MTSKTNTRPSYSAISSTHAVLKIVRNALHSAQEAIEAKQAEINGDNTISDDERKFCMDIINDTGSYLRVTLSHINEHRGNVLRILEDMADS